MRKIKDKQNFINKEISCVCSYFILNRTACLLPEFDSYVILIKALSIVLP